jgi:signal transduction histidine kinase
MSGVETYAHARTAQAGAASHGQEQTDDRRRDLIHDLLQPLSGILALTDVVQTSPCVCNGVERSQQVRALAVWMQQLLQTSHQVQDSDAATPGAECDACAVCRTVVGAAPRAGLALIIVRADAPAPVCVEEIVLRRIVGNVVDNAVRAAGPDGHVELGIAVRDQHVVIEVTDDGPGFGRIEANTGRGLSITRRLLESCQGCSIEIREAPRGGVNVSISLPIGVTAQRHAS